LFIGSLIFAEPKNPDRAGSLTEIATMTKRQFHYGARSHANELAEPTDVTMHEFTWPIRIMLLQHASGGWRA
jgi:hypothetical protein